MLSFRTQETDTVRCPGRLIAGLIFLLCCAALSSFAAPPVNDNFVNALALSGLPITDEGSNVDATWQDGEPDVTGALGQDSVWWSWTCPSDGWVEMSAAHDRSVMVLSVFTGQELPSLAAVGTSHEYGVASRRRVVLKVSESTVYRIQVHGFSRSSVQGPISLAIKTVPMPVPPVLEKLTLAPASINVSTYTPATYVTIKMAAPAARLEADYILTGPNGESLTGAFYFWSVDESEGLFSGRIQVPSYRAPGLWAMAVHFRQEDGGEAWYGGAGHPPIPDGSDRSILFTNDDAVDLHAPRILSAALSLPQIDATSGTRRVTATIAAEDDLGVKDVYVTLRGPKGSTIQTSGSWRTAGSARSGVWETWIQVPAYSYPQTMLLSYSVADVAGRVTSYGAHAAPLPPSLAGSLQILNSGEVDTSGPEIINISADSVVDITEASRQVRFNVGLRDTIPGIRQVYLHLYGPGGIDLGQGLPIYESPHPNAETNSIQCQATLRIPRYSQPGTYFWMLETYDKDYSAAYFGNYYENTFPSPFSGFLIVENTGPVEAGPELIALSIDKSEVDISTGPATIKVNAKLGDVTAGLGHAEIYLVSPTDPNRNVLGYASLDVGSDRNGAVTVVETTTEVTVPGNLAPGIYHWGLSATDNSGWGSRFDGGKQWNRFPVGFEGTLKIINRGPVDTAPDLTAIATDAASVNITDSSRTVHVTTTFDSGISWFVGAYLRLMSPSGRATAVQTYISGPDGGNEPNASFTTTTDMVIPKFLPPGTYTWEITVYGSSSNMNTYGSLGGSAFPTGFSGTLIVENEGPVDEALPKVVASSFTPDIIPAGSSPRPVAFTVQASDDVGIGGVSIQLEIEAGWGSNFGKDQTLPLTLGSGTRQNGVWTGTAEVDERIQTRTSNVAVILTDLAGKVAGFNQPDGRYGSSSGLPLPALSQRYLIIQDLPADAYQAWNLSWPTLAYAGVGAIHSDPDGDGFPNGVEFLCGTDPLLPSHPGGPDPNASRAPAYNLTSDHLRVDYRLSAANAAQGTGNPLSLQPQSSSDPGSQWLNLTPFSISGDLWRAEVPRNGLKRQFLRFAVMP